MFTILLYPQTRVVILVNFYAELKKSLKIAASNSVGKAKNVYKTDAKNQFFLNCRFLLHFSVKVVIQFGLV